MHAALPGPRRACCHSATVERTEPSQAKYGVRCQSLQCSQPALIGGALSAVEIGLHERFGDGVNVRLIEACRKASKPSRHSRHGQGFVLRFAGPHGRSTCLGSCEIRRARTHARRRHFADAAPGAHDQLQALPVTSIAVSRAPRSDVALTVSHGRSLFHAECQRAGSPFGRCSGARLILGHRSSCNRSKSRRQENHTHVRFSNLTSEITDPLIDSRPYVRESRATISIGVSAILAPALSSAALFEA